MAIPGLKDFFKGSAEGLISGVTNGAANIISKLKADPTKVFEAETELEKLKITTSLELEKISVQMEQEVTKQIEAEQKGVSDRWTADMASDSWLSKNSRPIVLLSLMTFLFVMIITDSIPDIKFEVKPAYIDLMEILLITVVGAYFGGRTLEKYQTIRRR